MQQINDPDDELLWIALGYIGKEKEEKGKHGKGKKIKVNCLLIHYPLISTRFYADQLHKLLQEVPIHTEIHT